MNRMGFIFAIGSAILWGLVYTSYQRVLHVVSPVALLLVGSTLTTIIILPFALVSKGILPSLVDLSHKDSLLVVASLITGAVANFLIFSSIRILGAPTASIFEIAYPFFVVVFSYFAYQTKPSIHFTIGALFIITGAVVIILSGK